MRLGQVFAGLVIAIAAMLAALVLLVTASSRGAIEAMSEQVRLDVAGSTEARIGAWLGEARAAVDAIDDEVASGVVDPDDRERVEAALYALMRQHPELGELAFTRAELVSQGDDGAIVAASPRWQVAIERDGERLVTRSVVDGAESRRERAANGAFGATGFGPPAPADDPTAHPTFQIAASRLVAPGDILWTDLHYQERDHRVAVAAMKRVERPAFRGVARASLLADRLGETLRAAPPLEVAVIDEMGRIVVGFDPKDPLVEEPDQALRVRGSVAPELAAAIAGGSGRSEVDGRTWLYTVADLAGTQDWRLVILAPEDAYTADLVRARDRMLVASGLLVLGVIVAGFVALGEVHKGLLAIGQRAARMREFEFAASPPEARFADVREVLESLERAKTALRAMGKYVPVDLVRRLYQSNREPVLGGELMTVTLLFSDIAGFTTIAEQVGPNELAALLGRYLEVMTAAVHAEQGTVDKYIGDAVMALWNAPVACDDPDGRACRAALACQAATAGLEASPEWAGRPHLHTRIGLHRGEVIVGHFGAPDRMSYTALGDSVNLAARLEGLNKQYGTSILVSEAVAEAVRGRFELRVVDVVAVKGKKLPVRVYELLGVAGVGVAPAIRAYEAAFERYLARDFDAALGQLDETDGPSRVLAARCRALAASPPPSTWDGVFVATTK